MKDKFFDKCFKIVNLINEIQVLVNRKDDSDGDYDGNNAWIEFGDYNLSYDNYGSLKIELLEINTDRKIISIDANADFRKWTKEIILDKIIVSLEGKISKIRGLMSEKDIDKILKEKFDITKHIILNNLQ